MSALLLFGGTASAHVLTFAIGHGRLLLHTDAQIMTAFVLLLQVDMILETRGVQTVSEPGSGDQHCSLVPLMMQLS